MKTPLTTLSVALSIFFYSQLSPAVIFDKNMLEKMLHAASSDESRELVRLLQQTEELQIGGTHTYGNKTIIKSGQNEGRLDPKIMIINPDLKAHVDDKSLMSLKGSGFDLALLDTLNALCQMANHKFKKIYINNTLMILPVADGTYSASQQYFLKTGGFSPNTRDAETWFCQYVDHVQTYENDNLYKRYTAMLLPEGEFVFKSAGVFSLGAAISKTYFDVAMAVPNEKAMMRTFENKPADYYCFENTQAQTIFKGFQKALNQVGKFSEVDYLSTVKTYQDKPKSDHLLYTIQMQTYLLEISGLTITQVALARLQDWGFEKTPSAYSLIIRASMPK